MSIRRVSTVLLLAVLLLALWGAVARADGAALPQALRAAAAGAAGSHAAPPTASRQRLFVPGEVLVEFRAGVRTAERGRVADGVGARVVRRLPGTACAPGSTLVLVRSSSLTTAALMKCFSADPTVSRVSPNYWRHVDALTPDDPGLAYQWGLLRVGAGDAWERTTGAADVVVASIDTGVDVLHPDLAANMWHNPGEIAGNGLDDDGNGYVDDIYGIDTANGDNVPMDDYGHGTHTSGIMAGVGANGTGIAGMGWRTKVMALKFLDYQGWGTDADAVECIDYVIHEKLVDGVNVVAINASWGGFRGNLFLRNAIKSAGDAGIVFCASAGNDNEDNDEWPHYPSSYDCPTILSVAATGTDDALTWFSNYGDCTVDLAAPGLSILSAVTDGQYASWAGTSMATPFVTGAVALCATLYPGETAQQRVDRILSTVKPVEALQGTCMTGGLLDVPAALGLASPAGDTTAPVTTALGADATPRDIRTVVRFLASDGPNGSGVATTEWRLDGGEWKTGDAAAVPAPPGVAIVHTIEYRSTDRAGNMEDAGSCQVTIDTTDRSDDRIPGRPLPVSPVAGGVSFRDPMDAYRLSLRRGESFTLDLVGPQGVSAGVVLFGPGSHGEPLAFAAPFFDLGSSFAYRATVAVHGAVGGWRNVPVAVTFTGADGTGSGVAYTELSTDDGLAWYKAGGVVVEAPIDHSNDGVHLVLARAVDNAGNVSRVRATRVRIDTEGPTTEAWATDWRPWGPRGRHYVVVGFRVHDRTPRVRCQLVIRSAATGRVALRRSLGWRTTSEWAWWEDDYADYVMLDRSLLAKGTYDVRIGGFTHDVAGNRSSKAVCSEQLVIK